MAANVQNGASPLAANSLTGLQKVNVVNAGQTATATTTASLTANLPSTATPVAAANLPSTNSAGATYTEATSLVVYDNLGGSHTINLYFTNTGSNTWEVDAFDASKASVGGGFPYSSGPLATQTLSFNPTTGALSSGSPLSIAVPNGQTMNLDLSNMTQLAAGFNVTAATANGNAPSGISGVSISTSGSLTFNYANGTSSVAYDIPLANVVSPDNLASVNGGAYLQTSASGPVLSGNRRRRGLRLDRSLFARKLDGRFGHRTDRHDPGAERLRSQLQSVSDGRRHSRRPERAEAVSSTKPGHLR